MSAGVEQKEGGQDFDVNLAPIIDCFTVLITFMLASASFMAIGVFEANVAADSGAANTQSTPPSIRVDVELTMTKEVTLRVEGKTTMQKKLAGKDGAYDADALTAELKALVAKYPDTKGFVLGAADDVEYADVISTFESVRKQMPSIAILLRGL